MISVIANHIDKIVLRDGNLLQVGEILKNRLTGTFPSRPFIADLHYKDGTVERVEQLSNDHKPNYRLVFKVEVHCLNTEH